MLLTNYNYFLLERFRNKKLTKILIEMEENKDTFPINEKEVMDYYGYSGNFGRLKIKFKFLKSCILWHTPHRYQVFQFQCKDLEV